MKEQTNTYTSTYIVHVGKMEWKNSNRWCWNNKTGMRNSFDLVRRPQLHTYLFASMYVDLATIHIVHCECGQHSILNRVLVRGVSCVPDLTDFRPCSNRSANIFLFTFFISKSIMMGLTSPLNPQYGNFYLHQGSLLRTPHVMLAHQASGLSHCIEFDNGDIGFPINHISKVKKHITAYYRRALFLSNFVCMLLNVFFFLFSFRVLDVTLYVKCLSKETEVHFHSFQATKWHERYHAAWARWRHEGDGKRGNNSNA